MLENGAKPAIHFDRIALSRLQRVLGVDHVLHGFELGPGWFSRRTGLEIPLFEADLHEIRGSDVSTEQVDEAGGRVFAFDLRAVFADELFLVWRQEADGVFPDEQRSQEEGGDEQALEPILAAQCGDPGIFPDAEMGFLEDDLWLETDEPREQARLAIPAQRFVAEMIGVGAQDDGPSAQGPVDQYGVLIGALAPGVEHAPRRVKFVEVKRAVHRQLGRQSRWTCFPPGQRREIKAVRRAQQRGMIERDTPTSLNRARAHVGGWIARWRGRVDARWSNRRRIGPGRGRCARSDAGNREAHGPTDLEAREKGDDQAATAAHERLQPFVLRGGEVQRARFGPEVEQGAVLAITQLGQRPKVAPRGDKGVEALIEGLGAERIRAQRRVFRVIISGFKPEIEEMDQPESETAEGEEEGNERQSFHATLDLEALG